MNPNNAASTVTGIMLAALLAPACGGSQNNGRPRGAGGALRTWNWRRCPAARRSEAVSGDPGVRRSGWRSIAT